MRVVLFELTQWAARGGRVARAVVVGVRRPPPRTQGAEVLAARHGHEVGWLANASGLHEVAA